MKLKLLFSSPPSDEEEVVKDEAEKVDSRDARETLSEDDPEYVLNTEDGGRFYMDDNAYQGLGFKNGK